jgi:hypothetical protein
MAIHYPVPFYGNTPDGIHCFEASLQSVLKYFLPDRNFSMAEIEQITGKTEGLWTWPQPSLLWLHHHGFEVIQIEIFDYQRFINEGEQYLIEEYGERAGQEQISHSDITKERQICKAFLEEIEVTKSLPDIDDLKAYLDKGYLLICSINSRALNEREGYVGHAVVVIGYTEQSLFLHDPGLPPQENREVPFALFEKAWAYPTERVKNITAIKLK